MRWWIAWMLLGIVAVAGFRLSGEPAGDRPAAAPSILAGPATTPKTAAAMRVRALNPGSNPAPGPGPREPSTSTDRRTLEFEVIDGLAVAYGDVILGKVEEGSTATRGVHEPEPVRTWDRPEIPYLIHPELPEPERVERALQYLAQHTPVSFVPRTNQPDAIVFEVGAEHCLSVLGRQGGLQPIRLARGCQTQEILHEILHALGFIHEQSRVDRDQFVQVLWDNIEEKYRPQFAIVPDALAEATRATPFDYRSIMLYRPTAFALHPGAPTLRPTGQTPIDPVAEGLSEGDIARLKRLFRM